MALPLKPFEQSFFIPFFLDHLRPGVEKGKGKGYKSVNNGYSQDAIDAPIRNKLIEYQPNFNYHQPSIFTTNSIINTGYKVDKKDFKTSCIAMLHPLMPLVNNLKVYYKTKKKTHPFIKPSHVFLRVDPFRKLTSCIKTQVCNVGACERHNFTYVVCCTHQVAKPSLLTQC